VPAAISYVAVDGRAAGALPTIDEIKPEAEPAVRELSAAGIEVWLVTGDQAVTARAVAAAPASRPSMSWRRSCGR